MSPYNWKILDDYRQFEELLEDSRIRPALIFKHRPASPESISIKRVVEEGWDSLESQLDLYILDESRHKQLSDKITDFAGVDFTFPQVLLFADGVAMYDESGEMISVKKIKIALKIINRTFKWMESRA